MCIQKITPEILSSITPLEIRSLCHIGVIWKLRSFVLDALLQTHVETARVTHGLDRFSIRLKNLFRKKEMAQIFGPHKKPGTSSNGPTSQGRTIVRSLDRTIAWSYGCSVVRSLGRTVARSYWDDLKIRIIYIQPFTPNSCHDTTRSTQELHFQHQFYFIKNKKK